jgi:hypothetical protein
MAQNTSPNTQSQSPTREPSGLTLLRGRKPATKTLGLNTDGVLGVSQDYQKQSVFTYAHADAPDIGALFEFLEEESEDPNVFIIRGALREHVDPDRKVYRRKDINKHGDDAHFEECPRRWVMIDIDKLPLDGIDLINDPAGTASRAIEKYLSECYQNVSFVWQLSSSAGIGDDNGLLSIHIWFVLDRPVGHDELKAFHELKAPAVDRALFRPVQIHYIAAPMFDGGISDHLPKRIGLVELDNDEVSLPVLPPEAVASAYRTIGKGPTGTVHGFENKLKRLGDGDGLDGFHGPLRDAAASFVYGKFSQEIDCDRLKARFRGAMEKSPKRPDREHDLDRYTSDAYLDDIIGSAIKKFCQVPTYPEYPAPTMTPDQARNAIKSSLGKAADQHFEALDDWERENKPFHDFFDEQMEELKAAAKSSGEQLNLKEFRRLAFAKCKAVGLQRPKAIPKAVLSLAVGVGLGKTEQAIKLILYVRDRAQALVKAGGLSTPMRIAYKRLTRAILAVPTHKLADEAVMRVWKAGLSAEVFRGRLYEIKETGERPMCKRAGDVQLCIDAGLPVASSMCNSKDAECKFFRNCEYYAQMEMLENCDVVLIPHASLFHEKPSINSRGLLIIDEEFSFDGERERQELRVSVLRKDNDKVFVKGDDGKKVVDDDLTNTLHDYRETAAEGVIENADGNLAARTMWELAASDVAEAIRLEWQTVERLPVYPGMGSKQFKKALASAGAIRRMRLRVDFWMALLPLVTSDGKRKSGWLVRDTDEEDRAVVQVGGRATIKDGWFDGLAICLDATSSPDLVKLYFPKHEVVAPSAIEAVQANVTVLQTIDRAFSASMCMPIDGLEHDELRRRGNRAREVWRFILLRASEFRGQGAGGVDVLVICQQALEEHLKELGLPDNVEVVHFNAIRGIDRWGRVRCLITIGRTLPSPRDVEVLTENLTGWAVEKLPDGRWYPRQSAGVDVGGGIGLPVQAERHPDPMVEVIRRQICEAELIQCAGRGRGVNRSMDAPLQLDVLSNVCLPMEVRQPIRWDDNAPGRIEEMVGMGLLPDGPAAAALIYPDLWSTAKAAERAASQARGKTTPADVLEKFSKEPLSSPKSLLNIYSRDLGEDSAAPPSFPLPGSIDALVKSWGIKPLAFGAISRMHFSQAKVHRTNERALKFKFLFDPHPIPDPEEWLSERTGLDVEVEFSAPATPQRPSLSRSDQVEESLAVARASGP